MYINIREQWRIQTFGYGLWGTSCVADPDYRLGESNVSQYLTLIILCWRWPNSSLLHNAATQSVRCWNATTMWLIGNCTWWDIHANLHNKLHANVPAIISTNTLQYYCA